MWCFGDSFDLYATLADLAPGFWDVNGMSGAPLSGRFSGSRAAQPNSLTNATKSSGSNDAVHHITFAIFTSAALSGSTIGVYFQLSDAATAQCCISFRSDGAMLVTVGSPTGTVLATYTGAISLVSQWHAFEVEVVVNNTTGSVTVRKNGNTGTPDFQATNLNTRNGTTNNYANKLTFGANSSNQTVDDLLWRSDPSSVPWVGDIRCYTRMPASDAAVQFSRLSGIAVGRANNVTTSLSLGSSRYMLFTSPADGTISSVIVSISTAFTGNLKCAIFAASTSIQPGAVLGTSTPVNNPAIPSATFTFTAVPVTKGTQYFIGVMADGGYTNAVFTGAGGTNDAVVSGGITYANFPQSTPGGLSTAQVPYAWSATVSVTSNNSMVSETQQDGASSYVYDNVVGHSDLYGIGALAATPANIIAVTTRAFAQKSDAGSRTGAVQLKSGSTTVQSTNGSTLSTSWASMWRTDLTDPNTGVAWTQAAVDNAQIGPVLVS